MEKLTGQESAGLSPETNQDHDAAQAGHDEASTVGRLTVREVMERLRRSGDAAFHEIRYDPPPYFVTNQGPQPGLMPGHKIEWLDEALTDQDADA
jgi:hypothetical protein